MRNYPPYFDLPPLHQAKGVVRLPGSKSISNRTVLLAALSTGETQVRDLLDSEDVAHMLNALRTLGVVIESTSHGLRVHGCGGPFPVKQADLFLGNAGTAFRPLTAVLALCGGNYRLSGVARMHERPIGDLVDALRQIGADIRYSGQEGYPPLEIRPAGFVPGVSVRVRGNLSSQFLTALLMALPITGEPVHIEVVGELISKPYIALTLALMAQFGVRVERTQWQHFHIPAHQPYQSPGHVYVEGDASSASYFLAAGAIAGGPVRVLGVGRNSVQGDVRFGEALQALGARVSAGDNWIEVAAPPSGSLQAFDLDLNHIPDAAMTLAVTALFTNGPCRLRNIASWRVKETDRLAAMATELRKLGATVQESADALQVEPPAQLTPGAHIATYDDHRMAMCFSLAALGGVPIRILDPRCVAKTFPNYFERFGALVGIAPVIAIDGPSASGKGTVAAAVARALGYRYLDSGALYRLVALAAIERGVALSEHARITELAAQLDAQFQDGDIFLDAQRVTERIRMEDVSDASSQVSALEPVRAALLARQRDFRALPGLVADGRDMGSVVFPDANLKVFLTASPEERANRRYKQLMAKGISVSLSSLLADINVRDARDAQRRIAPLQRCQDAHLLDTTEMSVEQAVNQVLTWAESIQSAEPSDSN